MKSANIRVSNNLVGKPIPLNKALLVEAMEAKL